MTPDNAAVHLAQSWGRHELLHDLGDDLGHAIDVDALDAARGPAAGGGRVMLDIIGSLVGHSEVDLRDLARLDQHNLQLVVDALGRIR